MAIKKKISLKKGEKLERALQRISNELSTTKTGHYLLSEDLDLYVTDGKPKMRSLGYNAYYWGVVLKTIADYTGTDSQTLHLWYKSKFAVEHIEAFGEVVEVVKETSKMKTKEFDDYVMLIREHSIMIGAGYIPLPNELPDQTLVLLMERR